MVSICSAEKCGWTTTGKFCPKCGAKAIPYYTECPHCKKQIGVLNKFCEWCGRPVQEEVRAFVEQKRKEVIAEEKGRSVSRSEEKREKKEGEGK